MNISLRPASAILTATVLLICAFATSAWADDAATNAPPAWMQSRLEAIGRVVATLSYNGCRDGSMGGKARVGTGFVFKPAGSDVPVLVTTLHVVAGANCITYQFTNATKDYGQLY